MKNLLNIVFALIILLVASSCKVDKDYVVSIETEHDVMKAVLFDETPKHKENFIKLAQSGRYDSTIFHRVMKNFMIQGGDIDRKEGVVSKSTIPAEFVKKYFHKKGALAAARQPDNVNPKKASSWCQFYIVQGQKFDKNELTIDQGKMNNALGQLMQMEKYADLRQELTGLYQSGDMEGYSKKIASLKSIVEEELKINVSKNISADRVEAYSTVGGAPHLDDDYTVFGQVVEGLEVIDKVAEEPVGGGNKPHKDIFMKITVEELPKKKITELYGIEYPEEK